MLLERHCIFFRNNAASGISLWQRARSLQGADAFEEMFEPTGRPSELPAHFPTDVQAEIMVEGLIEPKYIKAIHFYNALDRDGWAKDFCAECLVTPSLFGRRSDFVQSIDS